MTKSSVRKLHPPPESSPELGLVVRAAKIIPAMPTQSRFSEPPSSPQAARCTGRCGHCDIHPCQLHTSV
jgi:hypothetical protein